MRLLLDTDAYSALKRGHPDTCDLVRRSDEVLLSTVVAGELLHGFRCGSRFERNRQELDEFIASPFVTRGAGDDDDCRPVRPRGGNAQEAGHADSDQRHLGCGAGDGDGADLISFDRHYEAVDGLAWRRPE